MMTEASFDIQARPRNNEPRASAPKRQSAPHAYGAASSHSTRGVLPALKVRFGRILRRPFRSMFQLGLLATGGVIAMNALMFQTTRHPAPWGGGGIISQASLDIPPLPPSRPSELAGPFLPSAALLATSPQQPASVQSANRDTTRAVSREVTAREANRLPLPRGEAQPRGDYALSGMQAPPVPPGAVKTISPQVKDPIGDLIRSGEPVRTAATARSSTKPRSE